MADTFSREKRSEIMAAIRGKGNRTTEWRLRARLISYGISDWRLNAVDILGKPDFVFELKKVVVFVDGCFWHGCTKCRHLPRTNRKFWKNKIDTNKARDKRITRALRRKGWMVIRIWEHDLKRSPIDVINRLILKLRGRS